MNSGPVDLDAVTRQFEAHVTTVRETAAQVARIEGEASSRDGSVRVRANATGAVTDVQLGPTTAGVSREWLGRTIVELAHRAAQQAAAQADTYYAGLREAQRELQDRIAAVDPLAAQRLRAATDATRAPVHPAPPAEPRRRTW
ncbi:YbaB/EbfC family nucleoid-associated protein [Nocardia stercoris]|uniref:YbaB/EbfC family DNA-binding protein n=1 Tax=Nocardia stercoris TaxID=2483361 RepID=A0A3M2KYS0_9NOCA|nr:YbaB/EbfC family nucleoid-associated protein [Nocardia stercoris]RMI28715.1 YbaB/EbfC family DNA-binding protein [Nocardia stercoris]